MHLSKVRALLKLKCFGNFRVAIWTDVQGPHNTGRAWLQPSAAFNHSLCTDCTRKLGANSTSLNAPNNGKTPRILKRLCGRQRVQAVPVLRQCFAEIARFVCTGTNLQ